MTSGSLVIHSTGLEAAIAVKYKVSTADLLDEVPRAGAVHTSSCLHGERKVQLRDDSPLPWHHVRKIYAGVGLALFPGVASCRKGSTSQHHDVWSQYGTVLTLVR